MNTLIALSLLAFAVIGYLVIWRWDAKREQEEEPHDPENGGGI